MRTGKSMVSKTCVVFVLILAICASFSFVVIPKVAKASTDEIVDKGDRLHWIDASVALPNDYTKIIGFTLTVKLLTDRTDGDGYGGEQEDGFKFPAYMLTVVAGSHDKTKLNKDAFAAPDGGDYEKFVDRNLGKQEIVKFGVGEGYYVAGYLDNGIGIQSAANIKKGDTVEMKYSGKTAIFTEENSVMTTYGYTAGFDILSVEWETGVPVEIEEEPWDYAEVDKYFDVATVSEEKQNGSNYVDITVPKLGKDKYPVVLWIHGGGYITGTRKACILDNTKEYLLANGYAFVSAEYTLTESNTDGTYGKGGMPRMLQDIKAAVRFLRANAATYKLDTRFIATMGESAGAGLSLQMGTTNGKSKDLNYEDLSMGNADFSSDVQAMVSFCGPSIFSGEDIGNMFALIGERVYTEEEAELERLAHVWEPLYQVNSETPAMFLSYSEEDTTVPIRHGERMAEEAKMFMDEADVKTIFYPTGGHVSKDTFDTYTAYVTLTQWMNTQRDKFIAPEEETSAKTGCGCGSVLDVGSIAGLGAGILALAAILLVCVKRKEA